MLDVSSEDIKGGSLFRVLLSLSIPLLVQNSVQVAQQIIDIFWVGKLGEGAVAAIGIDLPIISLLFVTQIGLYTGIQVLVSQRVGENEFRAAKRVVFHGAILAIATGFAVAVLGVAFGERIIALFNTTPEVAALAFQYLAIAAFTIPIRGLSDAFEAGFVGWGDSRIALHTNLVAVGVNVVLDPILIFGWGPISAMGFVGAAYATAIGYSVGLLFVLVMAFGPRETFTMTLDVGVSTDAFAELLQIGYPIMGKRLGSRLVNLVVIALIGAAAGTVGIAAYTIGSRVSSVAAIPAWGLQRASETIVGQNIGAENPARASGAIRTALGVAVALFAVVGAIQWLFPTPFVELFVPDASAEATRLSVEYLRILAYTYWIVGALNVLYAGFNGAGRTRTTMTLSIFRSWGLYLPIAVIGAFVLGRGITAIFWATFLSYALGLVVTAGHWHRSSGRILGRSESSAPAD